MSRHQRRQADPAVTLDLNALAASCNAACGGEALLWEGGKSVGEDLNMIEGALGDLSAACLENRPAGFAQHLGELVFDALALAGALGVDIAIEVERVRKRTEKAGK